MHFQDKSSFLAVKARRISVGTRQDSRPPLGRSLLRFFFLPMAYPVDRGYGRDWRVARSVKRARVRHIDPVLPAETTTSSRPAA